VSAASWIGLQHESKPKPPKAATGFRFFRRGLIVGGLMSACGTSAVWVAILRAAAGGP
jgi:hypothetical protein